MLERIVMRLCVLITFISTLLFANELITPIPQSIEVNKEKALLGKKLFLDPKLSQDGTISCASCHALNEGGDDGKEVSIGIRGQKGDLNAPTVLNSGFNIAQFWDGRAKDLAEQAKLPLINPKEMGATFESVVAAVLENEQYVEAFESLYGEVTIDNIAHAIAEFEKTLITPNAPFDRFLKGQSSAISQDAKDGFHLFKQKGCIACHNGINVGGNMYQKMGVFVPYNEGKPWEGRSNVTNNPKDRFFLKVPSLRNIDLTAPYFHDGMAKNLETAVQLMAYHQLGKPLNPEEVNKIVAFLKSLTGELYEIK